MELSRIPLSLFFSTFHQYLDDYNHEPGFLLSSYIASKLLPNYEIFALSIFIIFLYSLFKLHSAIQSRNLVAALLIVHLFLLFTLEFSTLRQCLAISLFNIGLAYAIVGKKAKSISFMLSASLFHFFALAYLLLYLFSVRSNLRPFLFIFPAALVALLLQIVGPSGLPFLPGFGGIGEKLVWYLEHRHVTSNLLEQLFFLLFYIFLVAWSFYNFTYNLDLSDNQKIILRMIFSMSLLALAFFDITVFRNRFLYEIIILVSILSYTTHIRYRLYLRALLLSWGAVFFAASLVKPAAFIYIPYQNYLVWILLGLQSDGEARHELLQYLYEGG